MNSNEVVRVGFVGAGTNTKLRHIPGFREVGGVELVSVSNRTRASSQKVVDEFNIQRVYDRWADLIEAPDIDAVCIGTWPYMHSTLVKAALEAEKHVLTEARMAMNASEAHSMQEASNEKPHLVTQIVPSPVTFKVDQAIQDLISDGYLGQVLSMDVVWSQGGFVDYDGPFHWRHDRDMSGYNIMYMGILYEAIMRWVGPASSVNALTKVTVPSRRDESGKTRHITVPDHIEILCEMASGPLAHFRFSSVTGLGPKDQVWLFGTEGTLWLDIPSMTLRGGRRGSDQLSEIDIPIEKQGSWRVEEEFINAIRGIEKVTHTTFADGIKYMEFTEAVTRSAQSGKIVKLPL